jgi:hypothetical protein
MSTSKNERRFFLCNGERVSADNLRKYPKSHIIGELRYLIEDGERLSALAIYEVSLESSIVPPMDVHIRVEIIGDAREIRCTCCHHQYKRWQIGKAALRQLLQRYARAML